MKKLIFLIILIVPVIVYSQQVIIDETTEIDKEKVQLNKSFSVIYQVTVQKTEFGIIDFPDEINFYGVIFQKAETKIRTVFTNDNENKTRIKITFHFEPDKEYLGEVIINPIKIKIKDSKGNEVLTLQTSEVRTTIIEAQDNSWILIIIIGGGVVLLLGIVFITIILIRRNKRKKIENEKQKAIEKEKLGEKIYSIYIQEKEKNAGKNKKIILTLATNLIKEYIIKKLEVRDLDEFYDNNKYDEMLKNEVKRFFKFCSTKKFEKGELTESEIEYLENNFKTLLFVI